MQKKNLAVGGCVAGWVAGWICNLCSGYHSQ
jgi:hypothetical protein